MLNSPGASTLPHSARAILIESPDRLEMASSPAAANTNDAARKVSGASSVTPSLSTGQLQPHTRVRMPTSSRLEAGAAGCAGAGRAALTCGLAALAKPRQISLDVARAPAAPAGRAG